MCDEWENSFMDIYILVYGNCNKYVSQSNRWFLTGYERIYICVQKRYEKQWIGIKAA